MGRFEYKYLVPMESLEDLRNSIRPFIETDTYMDEESNEYCIHSIYYDTRNLDFYYEKEAGIKDRKKIRIRGYNQPSTNSNVFLEIKRKDNNIISKNRAPVAFNNLQLLLETRDIEKYVIKNSNFEVYNDASRFFFNIYSQKLLPIINIHYNREAYFYKFDKSVRITFDKHLRSNAYPSANDLFNESNVINSLQGFFIVEIKFPNNEREMPLWCENILGKFGMERAALSKYCICLDAHKIAECRAMRAISV